MTALSSLHLDHTATDNPTGASTLGSEDSNVLYNRALRSLRKYLSNGVGAEERVSPTVPLVCCALFYCFESARGNVAAAMQHLRSGIMILTRAKDEARRVGANNSSSSGSNSSSGGSGSSSSSSNSSSSGSEESDDMTTLEQVFYRLDVQATMFDDMRVPLLAANPDDIPWSGAHPSTLGFSSISECQSALTQLQNWLLRFLITNENYKFWPEQPLPAHIREEKTRILNAYTRWGLAFDTFQENLRLRQFQEQAHSQFVLPSQPSTASGSQAPSQPQPGAYAATHATSIAVLRIHYLSFRLLLESSLPHDPTAFTTTGSSKHKSTINVILELAEGVLAASTQGSAADGNNNNKIVSAEAGIIAPVFLIAMKSGDATIVQRALSLLVASNRREGLYDAKVVIGIVENIMSRAADVAAESAQGYGSSSEAIKPLEYIDADNINIRVGGVDGIAKNLGVLDSSD